MIQHAQNDIERRRYIQDSFPVLMVDEPVERINPDPLFDRFDLPYLIRHHWMKLMIAPLGLAIVALMITFFLQPLFESSATLLVDPDFDRIVQVEETEPSRESSLESLKSLEVAVIADSIILRIVDKLDLRNEAGFLPKSLAEKPDLTDSEMLTFLKENRITATLLPETRLIQISVLDPSAERARKIAEEFSTEFGAFLHEQRNTELNDSRKLLAAKAQKARAAALEADQILKKFRLENPGLLVEQDHNLFSQRLTEIGSELNSVRQRKSLYEGREKALQDLDPKTSAIDIVEVAEYKDLEHVSELLNAMTAAKARLGAVGQAYRENHPSYRAALATVLEHEELLTSLAESIKSATTSSLRSLREREKLLDEQLDEAMTDFGQIKALSSEFRAIQQQSEKEWAAYTAFQQKLADSEVSSVWSNQIATMVSPPLLPHKKARPRKMLAAVVGGLAGSFLSGAMLLWLIVKGAPVSSRLQLEEQFRLNVIEECSSRDNFLALRTSSGLSHFLSRNHSTVLVTSMGNDSARGASITQQIATAAASYGRSALYIKVTNDISSREIRRLTPNLFYLTVNASHVRNVSKFPKDLAQLQKSFTHIFIEADEIQDPQLIEFLGSLCVHKIIAVQSGETRKVEITERIQKLSDQDRRSVSLLLVSEN